MPGKMLTAGKIAKELGVPDAKIKKIIQELALEPAEKKGACSYYSSEQIARIKKEI
jgi:hypothetical protein